LDKLERPMCSSTQERRSCTLTLSNASLTSSAVNSTVSRGSTSTLAPISPSGDFSAKHLYLPNKDSITSLLPSHDWPAGTLLPSSFKYSLNSFKKLPRLASRDMVAVNCRQTRTDVCRPMPRFFTSSSVCLTTAIRRWYRVTSCRKSRNHPSFSSKKAFASSTVKPSNSASKAFSGMSSRSSIWPAHSVCLSTFMYLSSERGAGGVRNAPRLCCNWNRLDVQKRKKSDQRGSAPSSVLTREASLCVTS